MVQCKPKSSNSKSKTYIKAEERVVQAATVAVSMTVSLARHTGLVVSALDSRTGNPDSNLSPAT
jgi:hypothetical protein